MKTIAILAGLLAAAPLPAYAGSLYKCIGADGKAVYQQTPCAAQAAQAERRSFAPEPDPAPVRRIGADNDSANDDGPGYPTWEDMYPADAQARPRATIEPDPPRPGRAVASECLIDGVRVLHDGPCPNAASQLRTLDRSQLCDEIRDARGDASGEGASKRVYNRNKARDRYNC